jgi:hypothetical protein
LLALLKHQHLFSYDERMNLPYLPLLKFHSSTPLLCVFSSLSALLKPTCYKSFVLSKAYTCYKVSPSQHRLAKPDLSTSSQEILMPFLFMISLKFPHSSLTPFLPSLHKLFFSQIFLLCFLLP